MFNDPYLLIFAIVFLFIVILVYINRKLFFENFINYSEFSSDPKSLENSTLNENGFDKTTISPSYWYNYAPSENRSKCFACDATSNLQHGSRCIDCEKKGGRPVDESLNRVLTR